MSDRNSEREIFDAATDVSDVVEPTAQPSFTDESTSQTAATAPEPSEQPEGAEQPQQPANGEQPRAGGDLNVALRQERENAKALKTQFEQLQAQNTQLLQILQRSQQQPQPQPAQPPEPPADPFDLMLSKPDEWGKSLVAPVQTEMQRTREFYSQRFAFQQHGEEKVSEAYKALDAAISRGEINGETVKAHLSQSMDPYGDIVRWSDNQPANAEKRMRDKVIEELRASGRYVDDPAQPSQQPASASQPAGNTNLPSLNRAMGNAGASQGGAITDQDIFNSAPAFGRRKA